MQHLRVWLLRKPSWPSQSHISNKENQTSATISRGQSVKDREKPVPFANWRPSTLVFLGNQPTFDFCGKSGKTQSLLDLILKNRSLHGAKITWSVLFSLVSINDKLLHRIGTTPHSLPNPPVICFNGLSPSLHKTNLVKDWNSKWGMEGFEQKVHVWGPQSLDHQ